MSKKRTKLKNSLLALILSIAMILTNFTGFTTAKADGLQDVTKTGLKFNTSADFPTVETVYKAGDGTITFTPATADTPATLTLDNATINRKEDGKDTYTGAFHGIKLPDEEETPIKIVLYGKNEIAYCDNAIAGGTIYRKNILNVSGNGSLDIHDSLLGINGFYTYLNDITLTSHDMRGALILSKDCIITNCVINGVSDGYLNSGTIGTLEKNNQLVIKKSNVTVSVKEGNPPLNTTNTGSKILIEDSTIVASTEDGVAAIGGFANDITITNSKLNLAGGVLGIYEVNDSDEDGKITINGTSDVTITTPKNAGIRNNIKPSDKVIIGDSAKVTIIGKYGIRSGVAAQIKDTAELFVTATDMVVNHDNVDTTGYTAPAVGIDVDTTGDAASALAWDKTTSLQTYKYLHVYPKTVDVDITATAKDEVYDKTPKAGYDDTLFSFEPSSYTGGFTKTYFVKINDTYVKTTAANSGAKEDGAEPVYAGEYRVQFGIPEDVKYYECDKTLDFKIEPKEITVDVVVDNKEYDGTNSAKISSADLNGVCAGDDVSCADDVTATFDNAEIGKNKVISFTTFSLTGKDAANYKLKEQPQNITADIESEIHVWGKPQFTWSEDGTKATATFICENISSHTDTLDAVVTSELTEKATGTKKGEITYTATVTKDGKTYTDTKKVPTQISDIEKINQGILETQVRVSDDMPNTSIHGINLDIARKLITEEEVKSVDSGENIRIYLDATNINDTVSKEDKSLVQKVLVDILQKRIHESLYSVSQVKSGTYYIDLSLYKQVGDKAADKLHDTGDNKIKISVEIPKEIQAANRVYDIVRVHDNKAEVLDSVYDSTAKTLTFETTKFSTYAIVYSELLRYTPSVPSVPSGPVNPMVTPAPATTPSATPSVSESPAPGTTPAVSESPAPGTTPVVSENPSVNPSATPVVTGEPTATPAVTTEPTVKPTKTPSGTEKDDDDAVFGKLKAKAVNSKKHKTTLKWSKVKQADGYFLYGSICNHDGKQYKVKYMGKVSKKTLSKVIKNLKKATYYKFKVVAYKNVNGKKVIIDQSVMVHTTTTGGKYGVAKAVKITKVGTKKFNTAKSVKLTLSKGKTSKITAKEIRADKNKPIRYHRDLCYETSNEKVAKVSKDGKITATGKGSCKIYVYAQNGVYNMVKVTVK